MRKFWGLIPTFGEVTKEKLVGGLPPAWIGLTEQIAKFIVWLSLSLLLEIMGNKYTVSKKMTSLILKLTLIFHQVVFLPDCKKSEQKLKYLENEKFSGETKNICHYD